VVAPFPNGSEDQISRLVPIIVESGTILSIFPLMGKCSCTDRFCILSLACGYDRNIYLWVTSHVHLSEFSMSSYLSLPSVDLTSIKMSPIIVSSCVYLFVSPLNLRPTQGIVVCLFIPSLRPFSRAPFLKFSSVIVRVGLGLSHGDSHHANGTISSTRNRWTTRASIRPSNSERSYSAPFPGRSVQVSLQQSIHTHTDGFDIENDISSTHKAGSFHAI